MKIIRVFPRRTNATPTDTDAYIGSPDMFVEADKTGNRDPEWIKFAWPWIRPAAICANPEYKLFIKENNSKKSV
ncbi:MAG: hypothetical protein Ta2B_14360 [Termitinemataceae bacterium]|nr:MAG: hypothetical protein Ta2B_14360 [Termitinemataceae bacterium]